MRTTALATAGLLALSSSLPAAAQEGAGYPEAVTELEAVAREGSAAVQRTWTREELLQAFYDWLTPHGRWEEHPRWGWIWFHADEGYRPFTDGRWKGSERGAQYVADTDFAWAVYHYGRWIYFAGRGWAWVPGFEWAESSVRFDDHQKYLASTGAEPEEPVVIHEPWPAGVAVGWESTVTWPQPVTIAPPAYSAPRPVRHHRPPPAVHFTAPARGTAAVRMAPPAVHRSAPAGSAHPAAPAHPAKKKGAAGPGWLPSKPRP